MAVIGSKFLVLPCGDGARVDSTGLAEWLTIDPKKTEGIAIFEAEFSLRGTSDLH